MTQNSKNSGKARPLSPMAILPQLFADGEFSAAVGRTVALLSPAPAGKMFDATGGLDRIGISHQLGRMHQAQKEIVRNILRLEVELKTSKENKEITNAERSTIAVRCETSIWIWRRIADSIFWLLTSGQVWLLRRLYRGDERPTLSTSNIESCLAVADKLLAEQGLRFPLLSDITTFCDSGDILLLDLDTGAFNVIELKEGAVNKAIGTLLPAYVSAEPPQSVFDGIAAAHGAYAEEQAKRMLRQIRSLAQLEELLRANFGTDNSGTIIKLSSEIINLTGFDELVAEALHTAQNSGKQQYAIDCIQETCYLGAYRTPFLAELAFNEWFKSCDGDGPIIDYMSGFFEPHAPPVFYKLPWKLCLPLLQRSLLLLMAINIKELFRCGEPLGMKFSWLTERETRKRQASLPGRYKMFEWRKRIIEAKVGDSNIMLGDGVLGRIFYDFTLPTEALRTVSPSILKS